MSNEKNFKEFFHYKYEKFLSLLIHLLTGFGIIAGFFSLISVINNDQVNAFLWLGLAFLIVPVLSWFWMNEQISLNTIFGGVIIVIGVWIAVS